jgi:hypothetical protein
MLSESKYMCALFFSFLGFFELTEYFPDFQHWIRMGASQSVVESASHLAVAWETNDISNWFTTEDFATLLRILNVGDR